MSVAPRLYEQLTEAGEDKTRARLIAEAFEQREERYPNYLKDVAKQVRENELRLQKEIKSTEIKISADAKAVELKIAHLI